MATVEAAPSFRRTVALMTATSFAVPAAGVITAPILARALSADGRGELAAALAPAALMLAAATLGLPDALTFVLARRPDATRRAVLHASLITIALGATCFAIVLIALPFLGDGNDELSRFIVVATLVTIPALVIGVFRGAATGLQMWRAVAIERVISTIGRVVLFAGLYAAGQLTVFTAVLVNVILPIVSGVVYLPLFRKIDRVGVPEPDSVPEGELIRDASLRAVVGFGYRTWFGSVASMVLSRAAPLLMVPLSDATQLGLYTVATTVSDLPLIVSLAIAGTLYGVNAKTTNVEQVTATSRLTLLAGVACCVPLCATIPFWIGPLFGGEFTAATTVTIMLMSSALLCIPGLMASSALSAWGRPGLRSLGLTITLVFNVVVFVALVPPFGVTGAGWTSILSNVLMTSFMVGVAGRVIGVPARDFVLIRRSDLARAGSEAQKVFARIPLRAGRA